MHRPGIVAERMKRPAAERDDVAEAGLAGEVAGLGHGVQDGRAERRSRPRRPAPPASRRALPPDRRARRNAPAGQRFAGRCGDPPGTSSRSSLRQVEALDVARSPGKIGRRHAFDAGDAQLLGLAVDGVHRSRAGIGMGMRGAAGDARPLRRAPATADGNRGSSGRRSGDRRPGRSRRRAACASAATAPRACQPGRSSSQTWSK